MSTVLNDEDRKEVVSANLKRLIADRRLSQRELSRMTGDPVMTINDAVHGRRMPGVGLIARLCEALEVSSDEIIGLPKKKSRRSA